MSDKIYYTMREAATVLGMPTATLYNRTMYRKDLPAPSEMIGRRAFFSSAQVEALKGMVADLRASGELKHHTSHKKWKTVSA